MGQRVLRLSKVAQREAYRPRIVHADVPDACTEPDDVPKNLKRYKAGNADRSARYELYHRGYEAGSREIFDHEPSISGPLCE
jgi:hypothetical protein